MQAMHDGKVLAVRLSWRDQDSRLAHVDPAPGLPRPGRPATVQGASTSPSSAWGWLGMRWTSGFLERRRAGRPGAVCRRGHGLSLCRFPPAPLRGAWSVGPCAHPTVCQPRDFITAWAAGNQRSDPTRPRPGSSLQAKGFGSLTMRPRVSQVADGPRAAGSRGRWTVVLRRPSAVAFDAGLARPGGDHGSIAFALWDGASARPRRSETGLDLA